MNAIFIPPEAAPYCDSKGIIDWKKVQKKIRQELGEGCGVESEYQLSLIVKGIATDKYGALPIMRSLKLDLIISARKINSTHWHIKHSQELAAQYAKDFGLDITKVPGTGPDGIILKTDIVAYHRLLKAGKAPGPLAAAAESLDLPRLLRQRRILASHIYRMKMTQREAVALLDTASQTIHDLHGAVDAANIRTDDATDRLAATSEKLGNALTERLAAEVRADRFEQMFDSLQIDFDKACTDRTSAISRAIAAEARAAQADRMLSQILSELRQPSILHRTGAWLSRALGALHLSPKGTHA